MIIALTGYMGSGKTAVGRRLAESTGYPFVDLDEYITRRTGFTPARIIREAGETVFRIRETQLLEELLEKYGDLVLATGGGTFVLPENKKMLKNKALTVFIDTPFDKIKERLEKEYTHRPVLPRDTTGKPGWEAVRAHYRNRLPAYRKADIIFFNPYDTPGEAAENLYREIKNYL